MMIILSLKMYLPVQRVSHYFFFFYTVNKLLGRLWGGPVLSLRAPSTRDFATTQYVSCLLRLKTLLDRPFSSSSAVRSNVSLACAAVVSFFNIVTIQEQNALYSPFARIDYIRTESKSHLIVKKLVHAETIQKRFSVVLFESSSVFLSTSERHHQR